MEHCILTASCEDKIGIVAAVSGFLAKYDGFIIESQQFGDMTTGFFFMRTHFTSEKYSLDNLKKRFQIIADEFSMKWEMQLLSYRMKVLIMASKEGHCVNALLNKKSMGNLAIDVPAIISNQPDLENMAKSYNTPFYYLPVSPGNKKEQEAEVLKLIQEFKPDLIVLARYMQILSDDFIRGYEGKIINIHHSFLPSFKGARPYHQAFDHGVKLIGATAHYVSEKLDEGPIIEQEVTRVSHTFLTPELVSIGQDIEIVTLTRAVKWHIQKRVLLNGNKTVVFT
jgi:formyltetrahydrofolate deformylase